MNWKAMILEIQASGMSQKQIAEAIGKSQAWVSAVANGAYSDVRWADGQALIHLHSARAELQQKAA